MAPAAGPDRPQLLVAGSIALDTLDGPFGHVEDELGGSALYFALAASLIRPVAIVAPVGPDGAGLVRHALAGRAVDLAGLDEVDAPTYRWRARAEGGRNRDLGNRDSIYDRWSPRARAGYAGWAFVGSMRSDRQLEAARGLGGAALLAADAMLSYVAARPVEAAALLDLAGWYFANAEELAALGGDDPARFRAEHGLEALVVKAGPGGASLHTAGGSVHVPALVVGPVLDTTGAGDSLAGGLLARWSVIGGRPDGLADALRWGVAAASLAIEDVGIRALVKATPADLEERVRWVGKPVFRGS